MKITDHVHALRIPFIIQLGPGRALDRFVYSYLIVDDKICLIDTGVAHSEQLIFDYVKHIGREPHEISLMILTHSHPDHIGSAKAIKEATDCIVAANADEKLWIEDIEQQFQERPVPGFHSLVGGSVPVDRLIEDGDTVRIGGITLEIFHCPGHSRGSISLFCREEGVLFSGDTIPQKGDLPIYEDAVASVKSIERLKSINGIEFLLASWSDPREGKETYQIMDNGLSYLKSIHSAILSISDESMLRDPMTLCSKVVHDLGLPEIAANPIVAKSFASHLPVRNCTNLVGDCKKDDR